MLDQLFRTNEAAQSTVQGILLSIAASFVMSFLLVVTYRLTSREVVERREFIQGMALISIVATMIMQAIGDSLARGLGMLGALSIIRFRTSLASPRNMAFMFASLAAGIACGVFGFTIALVGTVAFCLVAGALSFEFRGDQGLVTGELRLTVPAEAEAVSEVEARLRPFTRRLQLSDRRFVAATAKPLPAAPEEGVDPGSARLAQSTADVADAPAMTGTPTTTPITKSRTGSRAPAALGSGGSPFGKTDYTQVLTYRFRLRDPGSEARLLEAVASVPGVIDQRLRFTRNTEML